jgi:anti-sigma factor RsiW
MDLEKHLKSALSRKTPPPDFTARVMSAIGRQQAGQAGAPVLHRWWRAAAAAVMLTAIAGGWTAHQVAERRAGERARDEVMVALHIAGAKVHYAQKQVHDIGSKH